MHVVEQFRHIILSYPLHIFTDHNPLIGALRQPTKHQCLQRWSMLIQEYETAIHYVGWKNNNLADLLSRNPINDSTSDDDDLNANFHKDLLHRSDHYIYKFRMNDNVCYDIQDFIPEKV